LLLALSLPFLWKAPLWILLVFWCLKPWLDRGTLFVLSRVVFGQSATLWDFLREWRSVHRRGLLAGLLWRRFSPMRSYTLPVFQLEGLRGSGYRARVQVLTRQGGGAAFMLTCAGWIFTLLTFIGFLALFQAMVPPGARVQVWGGFEAMRPGFQWFLLGLGILALTLTEPFFVAAGFGLYLNRRTLLEGWDLELAFRRLGTRLLAVLLLALGGLSLRAQEPGVPPQTPSVEAPAETLPKEGPLRPEEEALKRAQRVFKEDPAFRHTEEVRTLRYRPTGREPRWLRSLLDGLFGPKEPEKPKELKPPSLFMDGLGELIALAGKVVLVGGLIILLLWLLYRFRHRLGLPALTSDDWEAPEAVAGLDIRPESLPPDVPAAARNLFLRGEARAALALLYRGALAELIHRKGMEIPVSATEGDCLRAAREHMDAAPAATFRTLTHTWQRLAYKDEAPDRDAFEALCEQWPLAFGGRR
jgi:hypothetical protein